VPGSSRLRESLRWDFPERGTRVVCLETCGLAIELIEDRNWHPVDRPGPPRHTIAQGVCQIRSNVPDSEAVIEHLKAGPGISIAWDLVVFGDSGFAAFCTRDNAAYRASWQSAADKSGAPAAPEPNNPP
jgi:methylmalonyl-CoA/ethylmalonyl-CoA epimerase